MFWKSWDDASADIAGVLGAFVVFAGAVMLFAFLNSEPPHEFKKMESSDVTCDADHRTVYIKPGYYNGMVNDFLAACAKQFAEESK